MLANSSTRAGYYCISASESLSLDSRQFEVQPGQTYEARTWAVGFEGKPGCVLVALIFLGEAGKEIKREVALVDDFSSRAKQYRIQAQAPSGASQAIIGYRINEELPSGSPRERAKLWLDLPHLFELSNGSVKEIPTSTRANGITDRLPEFRCSCAMTQAISRKTTVENIRPVERLHERIGDGSPSKQEGHYYDIPDHQTLALNSEPFEVTAGKSYELKCWARRIRGTPRCAFVGLVFLDKNDNELRREICWIDDFSGTPTEYAIRGKAPLLAKKAVAIYRVNTEVPEPANRAAAEFWLQPPEQLRIHEAGVTTSSDGRLPYVSVDERSPVSEEELRGVILKAAAFLGPYAENYTPYHLARFVGLWKLIPFGEGQKLLELGAFFPFTYALRRYAGYAEIVTADLTTWAKSAEGDSESFVTTISMDGAPPEIFHSQVFNVETDKFPYPPGTFDCVLACEIIEHLALDPMFMLSEINRVLKKDGLLIMSTPNVTSLKSVVAILEGDNPVGLHTYSKNRNLYARHHREYTPGELSLLVRKAGFKVLKMRTLDVWGNYAHLRSHITPLSRAGISLVERGDCIFLAAQKAAPRILERYPEQFYKD